MPVPLKCAIFNEHIDFESKERRNEMNFELIHNFTNEQAYTFIYLYLSVYFYLL